MAGSRIEKLGTVFTRVKGLLQSGALKEADKPIWYDVYAAFPPRMEPKFDRVIQKQEPVNILYREDAIRGKFFNTFGSPDVIDMKQNNSLCYSERFIKRYAELTSQAIGQSESQLFDSVKESLKSEGLKLKTLAEIEEEKKALKETKLSESTRTSHQVESQDSVDILLQKLTANQEANDFVHDDILDPELKQK